MSTKKATPSKKVKTPATKSAVFKVPQSHTEPIFPYTNKPGSLRKFLQLVPEKPRPAKVEKTIMQSWGFRDTNDMSILRVLRAVGLLNSTNEPTELYTAFMNIKGGAVALAKPVKELYAPLFAASHTPYKESPEALRNLFNIHSGGSAVTLDYQVQTFKALTESTTFDVPQGGESYVPKLGIQNAPSKANNGSSMEQNTPNVHIDLHIHLPENKSRRDYEAMIEDIGRYIYGRDASGAADE